MKNKFITVLGASLLLFILAIAIPSFAYNANYQEIYNKAFDEESSCLSALKDDYSLIGDCVSKTQSRIDKQHNLAEWKKGRATTVDERIRLTNVQLELEKERKDIINFTLAQ